MHWFLSSTELKWTNESAHTSVDALVAALWLQLATAE